MNPGAPSVSLRAVAVEFASAQAASRVSALQGVSLDIAPGERVALVGANGCGKSTLLRVLHGLIDATQGQVLRAPGLRQAMLFQRPHMLRTSAQNNIAVGLWLQGLRWAPARARAALALERVGLGHVANQAARTLSGGQQQRLALARAWACEPGMLLLDEPTASLDPHAKHEVEALMADFASPALSMVFASHNLGQVKRLASRVLYLEQGRVLADLPVAEFFDAAVLRRTSSAAELFVKGELA